MAVPKKRTTSTKRGMRRSHHRAILPVLTKCANCGSPRPSHQACPTCGYFKGREALKVG